MADTCECAKEPSGYIKCGEIAYLAENRLASQEVGKLPIIKHCVSQVSVNILNKILFQQVLFNQPKSTLLRLYRFSAKIQT